jgi:hypothetical protein
MALTPNVKKLGAAGGIAAALAAFAHGADDCARAGVRASAGAGDDVARIAQGAPSDDIARIAPVAHRRQSALPAGDETLPIKSPASPERKFGEELASHTLDAVDLLLGVSGDTDQRPSWDTDSSALGAGSFLTFDARSSHADFTGALGAAKVGPPVFVIGQAPKSNLDAIALTAGSSLEVGEIQGECLSHGLSCVVLICGSEKHGSAAPCVASAHTAAVASVVSGAGRFDQMLRELLHERAARRLDTLTVYRLADTPDGPGIIRSLAKSRT